VRQEPIGLVPLEAPAPRQLPGQADDGLRSPLERRALDVADGSALFYPLLCVRGIVFRIDELVELTDHLVNMLELGDRPGTQCIREAL
jgi:hypothetical protein